MAGNDLGLGIGLSATSNTSRDLYMTGQQRAQRKAMAEYERKKQDDDNFLKLTKDFALKPGYEWHRLLREEAIANSGNTVDRLLKLKASGDPNWKNEVPKLEQEYNARMIELVSLNEQYKAIDDETKIMGQGGTYMPSDMVKFLSIYNNSKDRYDLIDKLQKAGVQNDPRGYFAYDPQKGDVNIMIPKAVDINQEIKKQSDLVPPLLAVSEKVWNGNKSIETTVKKRFKTREEAKAELAAHPTWYPGYSVDNLPPTLEDVRDTLMSDRDFYFQYVDSKGLNNTPVEDISNILLDELAINSGLKQTQKFGQENKGLTINNYVGQQGTEDKSKPSWTTDTFNAYSIVSDKQYNVKYLGVYTPKLPEFEFDIPNSVYDAAGNRVNTTQYKRFTKSDAFTGFMILPYYMKGDEKVPWTSHTSESANPPKLAGFTYFARIKMGNSLTVFQPYEKFTTAANAVPGDKSSKEAVFSNAKAQVEELLKEKYPKIQTVPKPKSNTWADMEKYINEVSKVVQ